MKKVVEQGDGLLSESSLLKAERSATGKVLVISASFCLRDGDDEEALKRVFDLVSNVLHSQLGDGAQ